MTEKEALKLALEALKYPLNQSHENFNVDMAELLAHRAITAIKEALAQPEQERNALPKAMNVVIAAMQADPGYAWSWHCNIAMAYVDEGVNRDVANQGAARFMKLLANVEPAHDILPTQTPDTKLNEQEPVAKVVLTERLGLPCLQWLDIDKQFDFKGGELLYTTPPQRKPLTDEQIGEIGKSHEKFSKAGNEWFDRWTFARAIEAAHGIKE